MPRGQLMTKAMVKKTFAEIKRSDGNKALAAKQSDPPVASATFKARLERAISLAPKFGLKVPPEATKVTPGGRKQGLVPDKAILRDQDTIRELRKQLLSAKREEITRDKVWDFLTGIKGYDARPPRWTWDQRQSKSGPGVPTLMLSDLHWGETVFSNQIFGMNDYNLTIAQERIQRVTGSTITLLRDHMVSPDYPGLILILGGDLVTGDIHEELSATNEDDIVPVAEDMVDNLVTCVTSLIDEFGEVCCFGISGNHGRTTKKIRMKNYNEVNWDWMIMGMVARIIARDSKYKDRFTLVRSSGRDMNFNLYGHRYRLTHGDQFRGGDGIIGPLGPITRGDSKKRAQATMMPGNIGYDTLVLGHFHRYMALPTMIVNGSLKGFDEFALSNNFPYEPPVQALWMTHPRYHITFHMPVFAEPPAEKPNEPWVSWAERHVQPKRRR